MIIAIDFDGTLVTGPMPRGRALRWVAGARDALAALLDAGHDVIIYSCRSNPDVCPPWMMEQMTEWLSSHGFLRARHEGSLTISTGGKPLADLYIDDRAVRLSPVNANGAFGGSTWAEIRSYYGVEGASA